MRLQRVGEGAGAVGPGGEVETALPVLPGAANPLRRPLPARPGTGCSNRRRLLVPIGLRMAAWLVPLLASGCGNQTGEPVELRFWGMGREGEVVLELVRDFEGENPGIRVRVQQIPWSAAHEKLLTSYVGRSTPDIAQLGNTWMAEFAALRALEPLESWIAASSALAPDDYFAGIWDTNVIDGTAYGIPWYVDTRLLFYRTDLLAQAGHETIPGSWDGWRAAMQDVKRVVGNDRYAIFLPVNEPTEVTILGLQAGSSLLREEATAGAFSEGPFRRGFEFYLGLFRDGLAPPFQNTQIANIYQEFARGYFAMYITGPWNLGEFRRQLPPEQQDDWATAPLPGPTGPESGVSLAGGSSLVLFKASRHKMEAWRFIEYLSRPEVQERFYHLSGDLPARLEAWEDSALSSDPRTLAFRDQLQRVVPSPKVPEWENIFQRIHMWAAQAVYGRMPPDSALAGLDDEVDRILEKRRWLHERRGLQGGGGSTESLRHLGRLEDHATRELPMPAVDSEPGGSVARVGK